VFISPESVSGAISPITRGLQDILVAFGGQIQSRNNSKFDFTPLLQTRKGSSGAVDFNKVFKASFSPFGGGGREYDDRVVEVQRPDTREHIVAMAVKSEDKANPINAIFIADLDLVSNPMYQFWESETANLKLDNILFVYNCVDTLAGSTDYVSLRNRRAAQRTLERIDAERKQFVNNAQKDVREAETRAEETLAAARKRMQDEIDKLRNDKSIDAGRLEARLRLLEETENRKLSLQEKEINRERDENIRKSKAESEQKIRAIERRSQIWSWVLPPVPAILVGIIMFFVRLTDEQRGIVTDRLVRR
jgi:ABC-2 type transport system permease protein